MNHRLEQSNTGFIAKVFANRKNYFLYGNTLFWVAILIESVVINPDTLVSFFDFTRALYPAISGFFTTALLRIVFKKFKVHTYTLVPLTIVAFLYSISAALLWTYTFYVMGYIYGGELIRVTLYEMAHHFEINYIAIALWSCLYLGYKIWEESNNQKFQLEHERSLLKTAQLEMLRYQINPHFLFNTLNSARALVLIDPTLARNMLTQISEFLRYSLSEGKKSTIPLEKEMEAINNYLDIEKIRYKEKLIVEYNIDPKAKDFDIPVFLILPIVENAIKHGMKTTTLPLRIKLNAEVVNDFIQIDVVNSGSWIGDIKIDNNSTGTGLKNVQKRLENMYPDNFHFEIIKEDSFTHVVMKIKIEH